MKSNLQINEAEPTTVVLRRIRLSSLVKWQALAFALFGILVGMICTLWYVIARDLTRITATIWYFLVIALFYAIPGFISSILFGVIYNSLAGRLGGIEFEIVTNKKVNPQRPERWDGTLPKINEHEEPLTP